MSKSLTVPQLPHKTDVSNADDDVGTLSTAFDDAFDNLSSYLESDQNTVLTGVAVNNSSDYSADHNLGALPQANVIWATCTAGEHGYANGEKIIHSIGHNGSPSGGDSMLHYIDNSLLSTYRLRTSNGATVLYATSKATFREVALTNGNWTLSANAYLFNTSSRDDFTKPATVSGTSDDDDLNNLTGALDTSFTAVEAAIVGGTYLAGDINTTYVSPAQTITAGSTISLLTGLATSPFLISVSIKCISAELGYSVGDEVMISHQPGQNINTVGAFGEGGVTVSAKTFGGEYLYLVITDDSAGNSIAITDLTDTSAAYRRANITNAKWTISIKAWA